MYSKTATTTKTADLKGVYTKKQFYKGTMPKHTHTHTITECTAKQQQKKKKVDLKGEYTGKQFYKRTITYTEL